LERIKQLDFIKEFRVNTVFFDSEENLWLCTKNQGIFLLSKKSIDSKVYDLSKQSITTLAKDNLNRVWVGTNTGKIYYIENNKIVQQHFSSEPEIPIKNISCYKNLLSINWNTQMFSIFRTVDLGKNTIQVHDIALELYNKISSYRSKNYYYRFSWSIKALDFISENNIIIGSSNDLNRVDFSDGRVKGKKLINAVKSLSVITVGGNKYAGTNKGLRQCNASDVEVPLVSLKQKYPILTKPISCFSEDSQHALWIGTDGYGVFRLYKNQVQQIVDLNGMNVNYLYSENENNRIWIATNEGVFLLKLNMNISKLSYTIQKISLAQGLPTLEINCILVRDNELFVGTSKGLAVLPVQNIINSEKDFSRIPLIIKNIKINRQDTLVKQSYDLNYRQNNLDIDFVALSYKSDKNVKYEYKMVSENSDTLWHPVLDLHKEFSLLPPDKYEFSLRAFDINGNPSLPIKPISFIINPPFWDTVWFKILSFIFILSAIIFYFYLRTRNIQKKEEEKTKINKKFAELELQALQAQMNPHFVFNALSAIQNFILNNDAEEATDYLSRFSRLMRLFLESSRNKYIALSEEKTLLEYYIQLEQLRFKDKFTYQIILEEGVSLDTEIPSLLLQPFVENAINHGLVYKNTDDGYLNINFKKENDKIICVVEDNGIGRHEAATIKNKSLKPYKSRGTEITEERLRSLELIENTKIEIEIFDKTDENHIAQGTKVTIVMYL
jgi:Histidine kinase